MVGWDDIVAIFAMSVFYGWFSWRLANASEKEGVRDISVVIGTLVTIAFFLLMLRKEYADLGL